MSSSQSLQWRSPPLQKAGAQARASRELAVVETVDVVAVYEHLARLSDLRRAVGQGVKAVQRMAALPELSTLSHGAPTRPAAESDSGRSVESAE